MNTNNSSNQESLSNDIKALLANSKRLRLPDSMLSIEQARQALSLAEQLPDYEHNSLYLESHIELAAALRYSGFANQALNAIVRASSLLEYYEADDYSIRVHNLLAAIQISLGDYSQALASLDMAHRLAQSNGDLEAEAEALSNMGLTYGWLYQLDLAMEYFQQALKLCDQLESKPAFLVALLGNKAYALFLLNDMTSARSYALRGLELARQTQDRMYEVIILGSLSEIHVAMGDAHIAEAYLEEARQISEASDFLELKTQNLRNWSAFYINTNQFDAAITAFKECLALAEKHDIKPIMDECFQGLASVYEQQNDFASALEYLKSSSKVRETLHSERIRYRVSIQEESYRHEGLRQEHKALIEKNTLLEQLVSERNQALTIQQQLLEAIAELSTPVLPLLPGVLVVPLVGSLDTERVMRMHEQVLTSITETHAEVMLLDITGVPLVDTHVASGLIMIVRAAQLLGCKVIMVGIRPEIAQSLVGLGVELANMATRASLADGLSSALHGVGYKLVMR